MTLRIGFAIACVACFLAGPSLATEVTAPGGSSAIQVRLDLTVGDPLRADVEGCLKRGLESTGNVTVDPAASTTLRLIVVAQNTTAGDALAHLLYEAGYIRPATEDPDAVVIAYERLRAAPPDTSRWCGEVAREFDLRVAQRIRSGKEQLRRKLAPTSP